MIAAAPACWIGSELCVVAIITIAAMAVAILDATKDATKAVIMVDRATPAKTLAVRDGISASAAETTMTAATAAITTMVAILATPATVRASFRADAAVAAMAAKAMI